MRPNSSIISLAYVGETPVSGSLAIRGNTESSVKFTIQRSEATQYASRKARSFRSVARLIDRHWFELERIRKSFAPRSGPFEFERALPRAATVRIRKSFAARGDTCGNEKAVRIRKSFAARGDGSNSNP